MKIHLSPLFILAKSTYSQSVLESTAFRGTKVLDKNANYYQNIDGDTLLLSSIQNEIDSLFQHTTQLSENLGKDLSQQWSSSILPEFLPALDEAFQLSFDNATMTMQELSSLLSDDLQSTKLDHLESTSGGHSDGDDGHDDSFPFDNVISLHELNKSTSDDNQRKAVIEKAVEEVKGSEEKAKEMINEALSSLKKAKEQANDSATDRIEVERKNYDKKVQDLLFAETNLRQNEFFYTMKSKRKDEVGDTTLSESLFEDETWLNAGYMYTTDPLDESSVSEKSAVDLLQSLPLKKYRLRNDSKRDVLVTKGTSREEMRTRTHIGMIDTQIAAELIHPSFYPGDGEMEPTLLYYLNMKALTGIADEIDVLRTSISVLDSITTKSSNVSTLIHSLSEDVHSTDSFESISDLAAKVAAVEAELTTKKISSLLHSIKHALQMQREDMKLEKISSIMDAEAKSNLQESIDRIQQRSARDKQWIERDTSMKKIIEILNLINEVSISANKTVSEIKSLHQNAHDDVLSQVALIHADAEEERKHEATSLKTIRVLGEEARKALIQLIEVIFGHLVNGMLHLLTNEEGRHQVCMAILAATALVFAMSISKELISVIFNSVIRFFSMPRLVREWGCVSSRNQLRKAQISDIILPKDDKNRIVELCRTINKGRSRKAPLRNVLIHGKTGTGKSMIARAIAESALDVPFAIMSGADIAPLDHLGPSELRNVLSWANRQRKGGIIIMDEAESALGKRMRRQKTSKVDSSDGQSLAPARDALNVFLSMTGESGGNIMIILTTSNPSALDEAVLDRCDEMIICKEPGTRERFGILGKELNKRFNTERNTSQENDSIFSKFFLRKIKYLKLDTSFSVESALKHLSKDDMTLDFSGRELSKIIRAVETAVYSSENNILTMEIWNAVVHDLCMSIKSKKKLRKSKL